MTILKDIQERHIHIKEINLIRIRNKEVKQLNCSK